MSKECKVLREPIPGLKARRVHRAISAYRAHKDFEVIKGFRAQRASKDRRVIKASKVTRVRVTKEIKDFRVLIRDRKAIRGVEASRVLLAPPVTRA